MKMFWFEAIIQLGIISGFICVMGNSQYYIYKWQGKKQKIKTPIFLDFQKHIGNHM
ncbi:hypothetical protein MKW92_024404 [Papaver armeniacum]|nr:hypothetical protein MKW92_024404 [Papaver armeniacum]